MFEGLVHRVLVGYLGRYFKNIHKDQLKLSLWNEEVLLENVDLIPEAFDYLQLPFAIKQGRVGRLSIKLSWKKLGWDHPIIIAVEDVFICLSQRDDLEWNLDAVERREFAAKKAQLAAAELSKLSKRICDNRAGKSFISYITAKVLDSIQLSIGNFHVQYSDRQFESLQVLFGVQFSNLTVKQNLIGLFGGKVVNAQVNKTVDIEDLEIYCSTSNGAINPMSLSDAGDKLFWCSAKYGGNQLDHLLEPLNVSVSFVVHKAGKLDSDLPQYSIRAELNGLGISLNEVQLQQILILLDYLSTSHLREKYGRYRPWSCPISRKQDGWQKLWWHYAQQSILADVHRKLEKTSWKYLGQRLNFRRKYINLYKTKLEFLHQEQAIDDYVIRELEQMEKEAEIDDILSYRSTAEFKLEEVLSKSSPSNIGPNGTHSLINKSQNDEHSSSRSRSWLNWLSRGMLGAGGTDDSIQFSGVVSDEVVKDIYEATEFHQSVLSSGDVDSNNKMFTCSMKFSICRVAAMLLSKSSGQKFADLIFNELVIECKLWEELAMIICHFRSGEMFDPCNKKVILQMGRSDMEEDVLEHSCRVQVDMSPKWDVELLLKVMLQPVKVTFDIEFFLRLSELLTVLTSFEFQLERVLLSLNGIEDVRTRLLSKAEYTLSSHTKISWDVSIVNVGINVPWRRAMTGQYNLVLTLESLLYTSKLDLDSIASITEEQSPIPKQFSSSISACNVLIGSQVQDLYNYFEVKLNDFELNLMTPEHAQAISIVEKLSASINLASCIISDQLVSKKWEAYVNLSALNARFSPVIYESFMAYFAHVENLYSRSEYLVLREPASPVAMWNQTWASGFGFSIFASLDFVNFYLDLANDGKNSSEIVLSLQELDIWYSHSQFEECWVCANEIKIITSPLRGETDGHILCSYRKQLSSSSANHEDLGIQHSNWVEHFDHSCAEACFHLHYEACRNTDKFINKCTVSLDDIDFHCYPYIVGLLVGFYNKISAYGLSTASDNSSSPVTDAKSPKLASFDFERFGYSNFIETGSSDHASISLDCYPFITLHNYGSLVRLENSLRYPIADWRKLFNLRDRKLRSTKFCMKKGSKTFHASPLTLTSREDAFSASGSVCDANMLHIDINLCGVRVHFHDSSCIVGTVMLPTLKSSLSVFKESMDLLCSAEGLVLTSSWWTKNIQEFLWGPSLPNQSPVLNLRVSKGNFGSVSSELEVCIGIQHVCCMLPPEYLAIIIGYFSLPDWSSNPSEQLLTENLGGFNAENENNVVYKFEILDSILILPVEHNDRQFLKVELQQLYCSFIEKCARNDAMVNIPLENMVPAHKVAKTNHCLNIFGRDVSLTFLLGKEDEYGCLMLDRDTGSGNITLIAALSADLWVWLPYDNESCSESSVSTCVLSRITDCQLIADDCYSLDGFEALLDVIDQFSSVDDLSRNFNSDVLHFLQWKRSQKENCAVSTAASGIVLTEVRCSIDSSFIELHHSREGTALSEPIAKIDAKLKCSASLMNGSPLVLDLSLSSLGLYSLPSLVTLAQCVGSSSATSALHLHFQKSDKAENELNISLPSLSIWLHSFGWAGIIDLCNSYIKRKGDSALVEVSSKSSSKDLFVPTETLTLPVSQTSPKNISMPTFHESEDTKQDSVSLILKSEDISLAIHVPVCPETESGGTCTALVQEGRTQDVAFNTIEGKDYKFISVTAHSRSTELSMVGEIVTLKSSLQAACGSVEICEDKRVTKWPFFEISQFTVFTEICKNQPEFVNVNVGIQCDRINLQLSHQVLCFWRDVQLDIPDAGPSHPSFHHMNFNVHLRKISLLVSDERWSFGGPLLEIAMRNFLLQAIVTENSTESSVASGLEVNYNNIHKVLWEPFIEPWKFQINLMRKHEMTPLLNSSIMTDIDLTSTTQLNLNCTESLIECIFRTLEMVKDAWHAMDPNHLFQNQRSSSSQLSENISEGSYAPYMLQNLTSLPLVFHVFQGPVNADEFDVSEMKDVKSVQPGSSVPIYLNETPEEQLFRYGPSQSCDRLCEKQSHGVVHHFMSIQIDGMSLPSAPISMDLVGLTYFEVDFTKVSKRTEVEKTGNVPKYDIDLEENARFNSDSAFVVPVVFEVSVQRYTKLIRLYSTVILANATSVPLELRFDIPLGFSPKILDPIYPDEEFPLPLHLVEAGRMRWRPHGNSYLWSEVHDISNILSQENKIGFLRSFVCYPSHPSSDLFRCCISVQRFNLLSSRKPKKGLSVHNNNTLKLSVESRNGDQKKSNNRFLHQVTLSAPLVVINYLPDEVSLAIESGGVTRTVLLSEVETPFHHIDPSHDLGLELYVHGFRHATSKFPHVETFSAMAKFSGTKFSLTETMTFDFDSSDGQLCVTLEKTMDAFSGARELFIYVPFLLYNCTGFPLNISECNSETKGCHFTVPSCYVLVEDELLQHKKDGLRHLSSDPDLHLRAPQIVDSGSSSSKNHIVLSRRDATSHLRRCEGKHSILSSSSITFHEQSEKHDSIGQQASLNKCSSADSFETGRGKVKACMYSPHGVSSANEIMVRVCRHESAMENILNSSWSGPFLLVPPSGSSTMLVPQSLPNSALIISVTSIDLAGSFAGRTQAIAFQPRYIISNVCNKRLSYKQKGTHFSVRLGMGQHHQLHWKDTTRELLVSLCFDEPGWDWSGSFLPDHLGDTQLKMRNNSGVLRMIRVEVQNANVSATDEKITGSLHGNSGTNLILLSDDDTGFMPYRIDNFSKERLRVYQQKCENFDTIVHPYTSCPYAWDEPCFPHRLIVEIPGERIVGSYALDDLKDFMPVHLKATSEKPERTLLLSVHAEGAIKVLGIVDSSFHVLKDLKDPSLPWFQEKTKHDQKRKNVFYYKEKFSVVIPYIGISLVNSYPQELLFACAKNITLNLLQSLDQQKFSFQMSSLQIDNQLHTTPYPVILSFNQEYRNSTAGQSLKDDIDISKSERVLQSSCEPILSLAVVTWRKSDISLVSFEYIGLRVASFRLELEQELVLRMLDFYKAVSSRFQGNVLPFSDPKHLPLPYGVGFTHAQTSGYLKSKESQLHGNNFPAFWKSQTSTTTVPSVVPIGAPWQQISFSDRRQKKIYVELFDLAPVKFTLSFSSSPWMLRNGVLTSGESLIHRGLMALADVEGARIHLKQLKIAHQMASWESMQDILIRHYTRQLLHEMYKVFGSAGVIGNPMGFARSLGLGIRDFLSVPARSFLQSPSGLITGMAQGTTSLVSNTVYALSDAATQFSKAAQKGIVAFTFDDQSVATMEKQQKGVASHSKGVINEVLEGLTGLLHSPIKEAEKHGLPGVVSGIALGIAGLVARPAASILEVTGKTAQSIRNRSRLYQMGPQCHRARLPRPLSRELPLRPYCLEEAVGTSVLMEADDGLNLKNEVLVMCKLLKLAGKFVIVTERLVLVVSSPCLISFRKPEFRGFPIDPEWFIESEISLDSVIHVDNVEGVVNIVGTRSEALQKLNQLQSKKGVPTRTKSWNNSTSLPLSHTNLELASKKDAEELLWVLLSAIEQSKERRLGSGYVLHRSNIM